MDDLALKVRVVDGVEVDDAECAYASCGQIEGQWRPQTTRADTQHLRGLELLLTLHANLGHDQVARVAQDFVITENCFGFGFGKSGHKILDEILLGPTED